MIQVHGDIKEDYMVDENVQETLLKETNTPSEVQVKVPKVIFKEMKVKMSKMLLNIRKEPNLNSDVISQVSNNTRLNINLEKSNDEYYYVASKIMVNGTKIPVHGYCPRLYISDEI